MEKVKEPLVRNSRGVTLVELLASIALLSLVVTLVMSVFMVGQNAFERQTSKADMQDAVTLAMKEITKSIRSVRGDLVIIKNGVKLSETNCEKDFIEDQLQLIDNQGSIKTIFYLNGTELYKKDRIITDYIQSIKFTKTLNSNIQKAPDGSTYCSIDKIKIEIFSLDEQISQEATIYIRK